MKPISPAAIAVISLMQFLYGCAFDANKATLSGKASQVMNQAVEEPHNLSVLSVTGGLCLLAGMVLLVVTAGRKGWYPSIGGVVLIVLNFVVSKYSDFLFYPLVLFTGMISAAWTYKTVKQILVEKKAK
tara:strand:- start:8984 stop:9370 length:387 start_codon:yes stop_codon:yes gene_type:complete